MSSTNSALARDANHSSSMATQRAAPEGLGVAEASFLAAFEVILVDDPVNFDFDGSINRKHMRAIWTWLVRDVAPELPSLLEGDLENDGLSESALDKALPEILSRVRKLSADAEHSADLDHKLKSQMGGGEVRDRLPVIVNAFRCRSLLEKGSAFGRASGNLADPAALGAALQSMPLGDPGIAALLLHAVVGQATKPSVLITAAIEASSGSKEKVIKGARFGPLVDAVLAHAQNQISMLSSHTGPFSDTDKICRAIARFHRLMRSVTGYIELERGSRWSLIIAEVTKTMAFRIEPRLREISSDVSQSLRKSREAVDRVDNDRLLSALNGVYLLAALRDARESLALNALFDQVWGETGQNLEILLTRNMDLYKADPTDKNTEQRLDMGIKMAEIRFNAEYAEILRRGRESISRRTEGYSD